MIDEKGRTVLEYLAEHGLRYEWNGETAKYRLANRFNDRRTDTPYIYTAREVRSKAESLGWQAKE